ncbi:MAG: DUF5011 domain-containing protein [Kangiellaceae bacterium]|nr:DUF5011 domain-containing protein [Kangiellaceae bacterium]
MFSPRYKNSIIRLILFTTISFLLSACGGGGGGGGGGETPVVDTTAPVITITGDNPFNINQDDTYTDEGATATDNIDGSLSVTSSGEVDTAIIGSYTISYSAADAAGNTATADRIVNVNDAIAPVITLVGDETVSIVQGFSYEELGATAEDNNDGSVTVVITGEVDNDTIGSYEITYTATDNASNSSTLIRTVNVTSKPRIVAYADAGQANVDSYTPALHSSYNVAGGEIIATRSSTGSYNMQFLGLDLSAGNVLVSSYIDNSVCNVSSWGNDSVEVRCYDENGDLVDSLYLISVTLKQSSTANVIGYAWANNSTSENYTPSSSYSYNSSNGEIVAERIVTGSYSMQFVGLDFSSINAQVSAYNNSANCRLTFWEDETVYVTCVDGSGTNVDSPYTVSISRSQQASAVETIAYLWADRPSNEDYTPGAEYSYNASGGEITISREVTGSYDITLADLELNSGNIQVTGYSSNAVCNIGSWGSELVRVNCYDSDENLVDSRFTLNITDEITDTPNITAYAWADDASADSYTPDPSYSYNVTGEAITATRSATGDYSIEFTGLDLSSGNVQVTAYNSQAKCNVELWLNSSVSISCFDSSGAPVDSQYTVTVTGNIESEANIVAYAWANNSTEESYAPSSTYSFNSSGGNIEVTRSSTGFYEMEFTDLPLFSGNVQVSGYNSESHCNVISWVPSSVFVSCFDSNGDPIDSQYTVSVILNRPSIAKTVAYAWANNASSESYVPSGSFSYNFHNSTIEATRSGVGVYSMSFSGLQLNGGNFQSVAYGSSAICNISYWDPTVAHVNCFDDSGQPVDSQYSLSVTTK